MVRRMFKVGDRILHKVHKKKGSIVHIDGHSIGIEFDEFIGGSDCDGHAKTGHGWITSDINCELIEEPVIVNGEAYV